MEDLFDDGAHPGARDENGWSPLLWATFNGHTDVVKVLLQNGADTDFQRDVDDAVASAKEAAAARARTSIGGETKAPEEAPLLFNSPLHWAAQKAHMSILYLLLQANFDVDIKDECGNNALHLAATGGSLEAIKTVMFMGVQVAAHNGYGNSAIALATSAEGRALLKKCASQLRCPTCQKTFGGDVRMFLCDHCERVFTEDCSTRQDLVISVDSDATRPVRYCLACMEQIQVAEAVGCAQLRALPCCQGHAPRALPLTHVRGAVPAVFCRRSTTR